MAADATRHGLGDLVHDVDPGSSTIRVESAVDDVDSLLGAVNGRRVVLVVRDPQRHAWERSLAEQVLSLRPDSIVVDIGYPSWRPPAGTACLVTHGAGRANLAAAAERLLADG
jgi:beta-N-acetylhexosaminidase